MSIGYTMILVFRSNYLWLLNDQGMEQKLEVMNACNIISTLYSLSCSEQEILGYFKSEDLHVGAKRKSEASQQHVNLL